MPGRPARVVDQVHQQQPGPSSRVPLPDEVFEKIRQVDQQTSTLTSAGVRGFSARILDRVEHMVQTPKGSAEVMVNQLVELIKKPGQSLGLYLREGNGIDRCDGVFASRFGDNSELEKLGDIIRPGDEILSVNNVDVSRMSIDDVVLILSIPRRLLLRLRYWKNRRSGGAAHESSSITRPVVVFQKEELPRLDVDRGAANSMIAEPTPTANTWLGKRARAQLQEMQTTRQSASILGSPRQQFSTHSPRLLDSRGELVDTVSRIRGELVDTVSRTAHVPPPKFNASSSVRRTDSFSSEPPVYRHGHLQWSIVQQLYAQQQSHRSSRIQQSNMYTSPRSVVSDIYSSPSSTTAMAPTKSVLRPFQVPPLAWPQSSDPYKTNSLPRRRAISGAQPARSVKWRNDVIGGAHVMADFDSDGAISAPEMMLSPTLARTRRMMIPQANDYRVVCNGSVGGRTIDDIFSAQEYRNWAGAGMMERPSRWSHTYGEQHGTRSSSLPARTLLNQQGVQMEGTTMSPRSSPMSTRANLLDRLHISPLMNRRVPLRAAGPGFDVDRLATHSLTGILIVQIIEGRGLRMPEKQKAHTEDMYVVLEVNEMHRARTGVSTAEMRFRWMETFEMDVIDARDTDFFVYSWHPQYRHKLCHRGSLKLLEAFIVDRLNGERMFALNLEPRGQLIVRIGFLDMAAAFRRCANAPTVFASANVHTVFASALSHDSPPMVLTRLIGEIEHRGVDATGLYILCGSVEKKRAMREELEMDPASADLSMASIPDTNVLTDLVKDFLRELPEPLIPSAIYQMLDDASAVAMPNDPTGNRQLLMRILDCLPITNKKTLILLLDHLKTVQASEPLNGLTATRLTAVFGPLLFCSLHRPNIDTSKQPPDLLDGRHAARVMHHLFQIWPSRVKVDQSARVDDAANGKSLGNGASA